RNEGSVSGRDDDRDTKGRPIATPVPVPAVRSPGHRPGHHEFTDATGRIQQIARREAESMAGSFERVVKRFRFWSLIIVAIASVGYAAANYASKKADVAQVDQLREQLAAATRRVDVLEQYLRDISEDVHVIKVQILRHKE